MSQPDGADVREAARVVLIDSLGRTLLCRGVEPLSERVFWVMPGGGLDAGETFEEAAVREVFEETGISATIGSCVWHRRHRHTWDGREVEQFEKFFVARVSDAPPIEGCSPDSYVTDYRWWELEEILLSEEDFAPRRLSKFLLPLLQGEIPTEPIDCGV